MDIAIPRHRVIELIEMELKSVRIVGFGAGNLKNEANEGAWGYRVWLGLEVSFLHSSCMFRSLFRIPQWLPPWRGFLTTYYDVFA